MRESSAWIEDAVDDLIDKLFAIQRALERIARALEDAAKAPKW